MQAIRDRLVSAYCYDPGPFQGVTYRTYPNEFLAKIDWNINPSNMFSIRYNHFKSYHQGPPPIALAPSSRVPGVNTLQFENSGYTVYNNLNSVVAELNSTFGNGRFSNKAQTGYSVFRDFRKLPSPTFFLMIDITQGGTTYTGVGTEQFLAHNLLNANWGNRRLVGNNRLIEAAYSAATADVLVYTFRSGTQTYFIDSSLTSRWRTQVGVRYIFD